MLMNAILYQYGPRLCLFEYDPSIAPEKWAKPYLKVVLRKPLNFRTKEENF